MISVVLVVFRVTKNRHQDSIVTKEVFHVEGKKDTWKSEIQEEKD
jgi:hypothetical protein